MIHEKERLYVHIKHPAGILPELNMEKVPEYHARLEAYFREQLVRLMIATEIPIRETDTNFAIGSAWVTVKDPTEKAKVGNFLKISGIGRVA